MERSKDFLVEKTLEKPKAVWEYEADELRADISVFTGEELFAVQNFLDKKALSSEERKTLMDAKRTWWYDKYGFDYNDEPARTETLMRKYAPPKELADARALQEKLFAACKEHDEKKILELRSAYEQQYPDTLEGVAALFDLASFLDNDKQLDLHEQKGKERTDMITEVVYYQYLLTHFIAHNGNDKEFLRAFWDACEEIAKAKDNLRSLHMMRKGILSQVAVLKIMEKIGGKPKLSHPGEDAFHKIDLWIDAKKAVQVKGIKETMQQDPEIMETDTLSFPGVEVADGQDVKHFESDMFQKFQQFQVSIEAYRSLVGKNIKGYMIVVPYSKFDPITGEPSDDIVAFAREKIHLSTKQVKRKKGWF
ncbi:MAG: hypothetical protein Q8R40_04960 [bacterium]|nr:hypothetical protein [bacterium]